MEKSNGSNILTETSKQSGGKHIFHLACSTPYCYTNRERSVAMAIDMQNRYKKIDEWKSKNVDRIHLEVPKGVKEQWREQAQAEGKSLQKWIIEKVSRD